MVSSQKERRIADAITDALDDLLLDEVITFTERQCITDALGKVLSIEDLQLRNPWRFRFKVLKRLAQRKRWRKNPTEKPIKGRKQSLILHRRP